MKKRPILLILCACLFLFFPIEGLIHISQGSVPNIWDVFFCFAVPLFLLVGLIRVQKFGWYTLIAFGALWGLKDIYEFSAARGASSLSIFMHLLILLVSLAYFINPRVRKVYFDPKLKWWRSKTRFETYAPAIVKAEISHYPILRNLSEGGCFLETSWQPKIGDKIRLLIPAPEPLPASSISTQAEVRWVSRGNGAGVGMQFKSLDRKTLRTIKRYLNAQL